MMITSFITAPTLLHVLLKLKIEVVDESHMTFQNKAGKYCSLRAIQPTWTDPVSTTEYLTVDIMPPSGVHPKTVFQVMFLDGGRELEIAIMWPKAFLEHVSASQKVA